MECFFLRYNVGCAAVLSVCLEVIGEVARIERDISGGGKQRAVCSGLKIGYRAVITLYY